LLITEVGGVVNRDPPVTTATLRLAIPIVVPECLILLMRVVLKGVCVDGTTNPINDMDHSLWILIVFIRYSAAYQWPGAEIMMNVPRVIHIDLEFVQ